ncbi:enoyl-CoA hydratase/isomerase family protein [Capillimicrobium parvum]|uniref:Enoyl-CoA hydratase echA8 n=1 Tax=Capillimicrobium parvum TaxID=2884022 RepID=A0A9E6XXH2_9ACTN|nr:enoyl-CoA hydratase-related protein [Capillimicrobium parvum]UGS35557.1 putative enoyl-CoA hydratase echA8 [Capillimicrobium parvum]
MAVTFEADGAVGTITLDNPPANSYDLQVMTEFSEAVDAAIGSEARAIVVRSASPKFFSAGADVKKFLDGDVDANMAMIRTSQAAFKRMAAAPQLFLAHIAGHALGGGLEITLACDLRYASEGAYKLGTPEVTLGLLPGNGGTQRLTRLLGPSRAMDLLITGRTFSAQEALDWGLVSALYSADDAEAKVREQAERFAAGPALALAAIKRCVHEGGDQPLDRGLALEADLVETLFRSRDGNEGLTAFVEKRTPEFVGA